MQPPSALRSVDTWRAAGEAERVRANRDVLDLIGAEFTAAAEISPAEPLRCLHRQSGIEFAVVLGGSFQGGLDDADAGWIRTNIPDWYRNGAENVISNAARRQRREIATFLCARTLVPTSYVEQRIAHFDSAIRPVFDGPVDSSPFALTRREVGSLMTGSRWRLPWGDELEYIVRQSRGGGWIVQPSSNMRCAALEASGTTDERRADTLLELEVGEWVRERDAHDRISARSGSRLLYPWETGTEFMLCHAAVRHDPELEETVWCARLALDLPSSVSLA